MNLRRFYEIEDEVRQSIESTLNIIEQKHFSNYVLLLAHADYAHNIYCYGCNVNIIREENHILLVRDYLNYYVSLLHNPVAQSEFEYTIQMMIYCHLWESNYFLKIIKRIAYIVRGNKYLWNIRLDHTVSRQNIIKQSKEHLFKNKSLIANLIEKSYCADFRNSFAHMSYKFDLRDSRIVLYKDDSLAYKQVLSIEEWEERFVYSLLLTFHLFNSIDYRKNTFMDKYPDVEKILVDVPAVQKGKYNKKYVYPRRKCAKQVEFYCIPLDK